MDSDDLDDDDDLENALNDEDFGEEDIDLGDDDTFIDMPKKKKRGKEDLSKLFAAADEVLFFIQHEIFKSKPTKICFLSG